MENEKVAVDEAVETVAEENTRGYSKTVWNESTPITADKLNKMETGIANAIDKTEQIMRIPITNSEGWKQFRWISSNHDTVSWTRDASAGKALEIFNESTPKQLLLLTDSGNLTVNGNTVWHTGNFNPATKLDAGYFSISNRDLLIYNKRAMVGFDTADGDYLTINHDRDFGAGVKIYGLTRTDAIQNGGKLTFFNQIGGGQMSSLINCQELQNNTGNGQMMTAFSNRIYVGNPNTHLTIESGSNPIVNVGGREYQLYHTGNKPTAGDIGALPLSGGTMNGTLYMESGGKVRRRIASVASHGGTDLGDNNSRTTIQSNQVPTWWNGNDNRAMLVFDVPNPTDYIVRAGAGFVGAPGYITFSW